MNLEPETCAAASCDQTGVALIEQYAPAPDELTFEGTGEWIWLCQTHLLQEFER